MKVRRLFLLVLAVSLLLMPMAHAEEALMFSYVPVSGVDVLTPEEFAGVTPPEGLEEMYGLFLESDPSCTVYVFHPTNGRMLASLSCMEMDAALTFDELFTYREQLHAGLSELLGESAGNIGAFRQESFSGLDTMTTDMMLRTESGLTLSAQVRFFVRGIDLFELWQVSPASLSYVFSQQASGELSSDRRLMERMLKGLLFEDEAEAVEETGTETVVEPSLIDTEETEAPADEWPESIMNNMICDTPIAPSPTPGADPVADPAAYLQLTDDAGAFTLAAPLDTIAINPFTDADAVARARMLAAERPGGGECFDVIYDNTMEYGGWMLYSRENGLTMQVSVEQNAMYNGITTDMLVSLQDGALESLQETFESVSADGEPMYYDIDGLEHVWFTYDIEHAGMELLCYVIVGADGAGSLCELDVYVDINSGAEPRDAVEALMNMLDTMDYWPNEQP